MIEMIGLGIITTAIANARPQKHVRRECLATSLLSGAMDQARLLAISTL